MMLNNEVFVPPTCPNVDLVGDNFDPTSAISTQYAVVDNGRSATVEAFLFFRGPNNERDDQALCTDFIEVPRDSELAVKALSIDPEDEAAAARMGTMFCERIANCHGVVSGECWALGPNAVREVIEQMTE